jgi:SSS family transporter
VSHASFDHAVNLAAHGAAGSNLDATALAPTLLATAMRIGDVPTTALVVVAAYAAAIILVGVWANRRGSRDGNAASTSGYFLAARSMPVWAVAVSMLATMQSAATFVGVPEQAFNGNLVYLSASAAPIIAGLILARVFIPAYYRLGVTTPYQLLDTRFGPGARIATSWAYLIGRVFASGARLYVGAIPLALVLFGERTTTTLAIVLACLTIFAILYTLKGGLESVIWSDIVQVGVYVGAAACVLVFLWFHIPAPGSAVLAALSEGTAGGTGGGAGGSSDARSKLRVVELGINLLATPPIDVSQRFTVVTIITGWTLVNLAALGTDQDLVQRLLTCRDARRGSLSAIASTLVGLPVVVLFACVGLLLWVVCARPDVMGRPTPPELTGPGAEMLIRVAMHEMPGWLLGLVLAGVLAAGPAGHNATLNSMASTIVTDVYTPLKPGRSERHYLWVGRLMVCVCGVILCVFAICCAAWQSARGDQLIDFVLAVMTFAYAGLLGVFICALMTRRGTSASVVAALGTGFCVVLALEPTIFPRWAVHTPWIGASLEGVRIATPWAMCAGTLAAFLVCVAPRGRAATRGPAATRPSSLAGGRA